MFGTPPVDRLFGGNKGSRPIIMHILISDEQSESFIQLLEELAKQGEANLFYQTAELNLIMGNAEFLNKLNKNQMTGPKAA